MVSWSCVLDLVSYWSFIWKILLDDRGKCYVFFNHGFRCGFRRNPVFIEIYSFHQNLWLSLESTIFIEIRNEKSETAEEDNPSFYQKSAHTSITILSLYLSKVMTDRRPIASATQMKLVKCCIVTKRNIKYNIS